VVKSGTVSDYSEIFMGNASTRRLVYAALLLAYLLHNDLWLWHDSRIVLGLPVGLLYHVGFCVAASVILTLLIRFCWPLPHQPSSAAPAASHQDEAQP